MKATQKQKEFLHHLSDVGFPSVCYEYHWLIKKLAGPDRAGKTILKAGLNAGRKKAKS